MLGGATVAGRPADRAVGPLARHGLALSAGVTLYVARVQSRARVPGQAGLASAGLAFFGGARGILSHANCCWKGWLRLDAPETRAPRRSSRSSPRGRERGRWRRACGRATLDEFVGQEHLLAPGSRCATRSRTGRPGSMIFWGPPGSGKTTLARSGRQLDRARVRAVQRGDRRGAADARDRRRGARAARARWRADDPVRRRDPSPQQGAAGQPSAAGGRRHDYADRRDDRESQLRDDRRAALADAGVRAPAARCRGHRAPAAARAGRRRTRAGRVTADGGRQTR